MILDAVCPQNATEFCISPTVALQLLFVSKTILLTVIGGKMHLGLLPMLRHGFLPLLIRLDGDVFLFFHIFILNNYEGCE